MSPTSPAGRGARMVDVARLAGVSHQSVSRVVNGAGTVTPEIRDRVERAIEQLRYRRHPAARALATNQSMTIGVVSFGLAEFGPSVALSGIAEEVRSQGYATHIVSLQDIDRTTVRRALDHLVGDSVDAIVVLAPVDAAVNAIDSIDIDTPHVVFHPGGPLARNNIVTDEVRGAHLATESLISLGHRRVHHVAGPPGWLGTSARVRGWSDALRDAGLPLGPLLEGSWTTESGYAAGLRIADDPEATAVFAANDQMALGVIAALTDRGLSVPDDISVVGFDDLPGAAYFQPPLTTVRFDFAEVGRRAVDHILGLMAGVDLRPARAVEPELVMRESAGPPVTTPSLPRTKAKAKTT